MINRTRSKLRPEYVRGNSVSSHRPNVQIVSQVSLKFPCFGASDNTFEIAQDEVLRWLSSRAGTKLPDHAWEGRSFILDELAAQNTEAIKLSDTMWAARLIDADKEVPQRFWTTEFSIKVDQRRRDSVIFGCRLFCTAHGDNPAFTPSVPAVIRRLNERLGGTIDGWPLSQSAQYIQDPDSVENLVSLLSDPERQRAVIVISAPPYGESLLVSHNRLARSLTGIAHVIRISSESSHMLANYVGSEFSVFGGAVRTYRPGFQPDSDQPSEHPVASSSRIRYWEDDVQSFEDFLITRTIDEDVSRRRVRRELHSFSDIQAQFAQKESARLREEGASDSVLLAVAEGQIHDLEGKVEEMDQLLEIADGERDSRDKELEEAKTTIHKLRTRIDYLQATRPESYESGTELPDSLDDLEDWADKHLSGSVHILNRAYRAAKKTEFDDPSFVYRALCVLRDHYAPMRKGIKDRTDFDTACQELGLEETRSFTGSRYGEEGDTYFVRYNGRRRLLEQHLKNGNTRDPRRSFRLYFFWDNDGEQVVVGSLPSHLDSRAT